MNVGIIFIIIFFPITIYVSDHNHNEQHSKQWSDIVQLGKRFDKELEKAEKGQKYELEAVFQEMNSLLSKMVCFKCQQAYFGIIKENYNIVSKVEQKLTLNLLPIQDNEPGHHV